MIHPLIVHLNRIYFPNQWLFLLTAYELGKTEWQPRATVLEATTMRFKTTELPKFMQGLEAKGAIEQRKVNRDRMTFVEVRVTQRGKRDLQEALTATKPQRVPA